MGLRSVQGRSFEGLPASFSLLVENELSPNQAVPDDLYPLKQRAQGNPHYEFPIRSAAEPNFEVEGPFGMKLGTLSYGQALREAYPGGVYYYMAKPFRVKTLEYKKGRIKASSDRYLTTKPLMETMAFPDFSQGLICAWRSNDGFVAEVELQINERVKGFIEQRGQTRTAHEYGPGSPYSQKPLLRSFKTTGICWAFPERLERSDDVATAVMQAFAFTCGVHERDLGAALFHANTGPFSTDQVKGTVVFDATNGSLRLTERLGSRLGEIALAAIEQTEAPSPLAAHLRLLHELANAAEAVGAQREHTEPRRSDGDWITVIARQQPALFQSGDAPSEVTVLDFRYTPNGLMYELLPLKAPGFYALGDGTFEPRPSPKWMVLATTLRPIPGVTRTVRFNVVTGEDTAEKGER